MTQLQKKAEYRNDHQKQAAWLAADESDEYSTNSEQMAQNVILATVYGPVKSKAPLRQVDTAVSPGFVEGLAAAVAARSTPPLGRGTPKSATLPPTAATKVEIHRMPLAKIQLTAQASTPPARTAEKPAATTDVPITCSLTHVPIE